MVLFDRKKALNQIMGPSKHNAEAGGEKGINEGHELAKEAIDAVHAKDHVKYAEAQKALHMYHQGLMDPDQDGDEHSLVTGKLE